MTDDLEKYLELLEIGVPEHQAADSVGWDESRHIEINEDADNLKKIKRSKAKPTIRLMVNINAGAEDDARLSLDFLKLLNPGMADTHKIAHIDIFGEMNVLKKTDENTKP